MRRHVGPSQRVALPTNLLKALASISPPQRSHSSSHSSVPEPHAPSLQRSGRCHVPRDQAPRPRPHHPFRQRRPRRPRSTSPSRRYGRPTLRRPGGTISHHVFQSAAPVVDRVDTLGQGAFLRPHPPRRERLAGHAVVAVRSVASPRRLAVTRAHTAPLARRPSIVSEPDHRRRPPGARCSAGLDSARPSCAARSPPRRFSVPRMRSSLRRPAAAPNIPACRVSRRMSRYPTRLPPCAKPVISEHRADRVSDRPRDVVGVLQRKVQAMSTSSQAPPPASSACRATGSAPSPGRRRQRAHPSRPSAAGRACTAPIGVFATTRFVSESILEQCPSR